MTLVAGIGSSTQSCTIVLRDSGDGTIVATASAPHPPTMSPVSGEVAEVMKCWSPSSQLAAEPRAGSNPEPYLARYRVLAGRDALDAPPPTAARVKPALH